MRAAARGFRREAARRAPKVLRRSGRTAAAVSAGASRPAGTRTLHFQASCLVAHGVDVLLRIYAKCVVGQDELAKRRISEVLRQN